MITYTPDSSTPQDAVITLTGGGTLPTVALSPGTVMGMLSGDGHEGPTARSATAGVSPMFMPLVGGGTVVVDPAKVATVS